VILEIISFLFLICIIVFVHEMGHYMVARWFGAKVEVFSIGFGKTLYSRFDSNGTQWQIALIPLGGYVKFAGDADVASCRSDKEMSGNWADHGILWLAPPWIRILVALAGPIMNFLFSAIIFAVVYMWQGLPGDTAVVGGIDQFSPAAESEFMVGDRILKVDGQEVTDFQDFIQLFAGQMYDDDKTVKLITVMREGGEVVFPALYTMPAVVGTVYRGSAADTAGLQEGDHILRINGQEVDDFRDVIQIVRRGGVLNLTISRGINSNIELISVEPVLEERFFHDVQSVESRYLLGVSSGGAYGLTGAMKSVGIFTGMIAGTGRVIEVIKQNILFIRDLFNRNASFDDIGGVIRIAQGSGDVVKKGLMPSLIYVAIISTSIGFVNLLPIPVLDGGNIVVSSMEWIIGRPINEKVMKAVWGVGVVFVLCLVVFAAYNDLSRLWS